MARLTQPLEIRKYMRSAPRPGFDVVPFLDALLIALFVSLNASAFVLAPGTTIQLPSTQRMETIQAAPTAVLTVDRNELYFFHGKKLAKGSLESQLKRYIDTLKPSTDQGGAILLLKADADLSSKALFDLMDIARRAGFTKIHLAAELDLPSAAEDIFAR